MMGRLIVTSLGIPELNRKKTVRVYLPETAEIPSEGFPVLFMQDGHNLFDPATSAFGCSWNVGETMEAWERQGGPGLIVVGIDCPSVSRFDEYSPWPNAEPDRLPEAFRIGRTLGGEGEAYAQWLVRELKPWIAGRWPADPSRTWMAGSSMGAVISLYTAFRFPGAIRKIGAFSPAAWFAEGPLLDFLVCNARPEVGVWLDVGTAETSDPDDPGFPMRYLSGARKIRNVLTDAGVTDLRYAEIPRAIHHETAWAERFPSLIPWLFGF